MELQEIIISVIFLACIIWVGNHIYHYFRQVKDDDNPCAHCATGCDLKRMMEEKQQQCKDKSKKKKKSCCG